MGEFFKKSLPHMRGGLGVVGNLIKQKTLRKGSFFDSSGAHPVILKRSRRISIQILVE
jgi:hypothetical protein